MEGWMEGWMDGRWIDGVFKNIKIWDYILYGKKNEGGRKKYISKRKMKIIWGFIFFCQKKKSMLKEEKYDNWGFVFWLIYNIYLCFKGKDEN